MIQTLHTYLLQLLFLSGVIALALGINYIAAATWTGPSAFPPGNNIAAPLNIGTTNQVKDANLSVGHSTNIATDYGLISYGRIRSTIGGVEFPDGSVQTSAAGAGGMRAIDTGTFTSQGTVTVATPFSAVTVSGQNLQNGQTGSIVFSTFLSVININGTWKYAASDIIPNNLTMSGTLATGVQQCLTNFIPSVCMTKTAANTLVLVGGPLSGGAQQSFLYNVYGP
jgi:hypothetical protein